MFLQTILRIDFTQTLKIFFLYQNRFSQPRVLFFHGFSNQKSVNIEPPSRSGVHMGGGGRGARAPAPLRSDAKVPLRSGLCNMNDFVDDKNQ